jgi:hypothetical protein
MSSRRMRLNGLATTIVATSAAVALLAASPWAAAVPGRCAWSTARRPYRSNWRAARNVGERGQQTIWVAASPDAAHPLRATGWVLRPGHSLTITVPNH